MSGTVHRSRIFQPPCHFTQLLQLKRQSITHPTHLHAVVQPQPPTAMLPLLQHEGKWDQVLSLTALEAKPTNLHSQQTIVKALNQLNSGRLVDTYLQSLERSMFDSTGRSCRRLDLSEEISLRILYSKSAQRLYHFEESPHSICLGWCSVILVSS